MPTDFDRQGISDHEIWHAEADGHLSAELRGLKLIVRKSDACARYVIVRRAHSGCSESMLSSGTEPNVEAAMAAARRVATRIDVMLAERSTSMVHMDNRRITSVLAPLHKEG